jgi:hypothetical protein
MRRSSRARPVGDAGLAPRYPRDANGRLPLSVSPRGADGSFRDTPGVGGLPYGAIGMPHVSDRAGKLPARSLSRLAPATPTAIVSATIRSSAPADQPYAAPAGSRGRCRSTASVRAPACRVRTMVAISGFVDQTCGRRVTADGDSGWACWSAGRRLFAEWVRMRSSSEEDVFPSSGQSGGRSCGGSRGASLVPASPPAGLRPIR